MTQQRVKIYIPQRSEKRRLRLDSFQALQQFINHPRAIYQYVDSDCEFVQLESQQEWEEALEDLKDQGGKVLTLRVLYKKPERKCYVRCRPSPYQQGGFFHHLLSTLCEDQKPKKQSPEPKKQSPEQPQKKQSPAQSPAQPKQPAVEKQSPALPEAQPKQPAPQSVEKESPAQPQQSAIQQQSKPVLSNQQQSDHVQEAPSQALDQQQSKPQDADTSQGEVNEPHSSQQQSPSQPIEITIEEASEEEEEHQQPAPKPYQEELKVLETMGFENQALNLHVLKHHKGDVSKAIDALIQVTTSIHE